MIKRNTFEMYCDFTFWLIPLLHAKKILRHISHVFIKKAGYIMTRNPLKLQFPKLMKESQYEGQSTSQIHHHRASEWIYQSSTRNWDLRVRCKGLWQVNSIQKLLSFHPGVSEYKPRKMPSKIKQKNFNQWSRNPQFISTISEPT